MEDTSSKDARDIVALLEDKGAQDVVLLDIRANSSWADYMIIATVSSHVQARGLEKYLQESIHQSGRELHRNSQRSDQENWHLFDCGDMVVNLMTAEAREYYQLEELWFEADKLHQSSSSS